MLEIVKAFSDAAEKEIAYEVVDRRPGDIAACFADPSLATKDLEWTAKRGIQEMCADGWRWQSQNPNGFKDA